MPHEEDDDVPSPIDFQDPAQAREWVQDTLRRRPYRPHFFTAFVNTLNARFTSPFSILELGSGPGHLAEQIIKRSHVAKYTALDFAAPMHDMAYERLAPFLNRVDFVEQDFRAPDWTVGLGPFDVVATMQAAHEMRNKRHLVSHLAQARACLKPGGLMLYCDHYAEAGSDKNPELMAERAEQAEALTSAGFKNVRLAHDEGGMALYAADN